LEADIKACFDNISHQWILENIPIDKNILKQWLKAGYFEKNQCFPSDKGTPQGGIISPIIANMVLDGIEKLLNEEFDITLKNGYKAKNPYKINFVRYADDFIVTASSYEVLKNEVWPKLTIFLKERGLELSEDKTKITHIDEGFDFLGVTIKKYGNKIFTKPSKKSIKAIYSKIRSVVISMKTVEHFKLIDKLNPIIIGWANYHKPNVAKRIFSKLDNMVFKLLWKWAKRRHPNKSLRWVKKKYFKSIDRRNWVFAAKIGNMYYELKTFDKTKIIRHIKIKAAANPFDKDWQEYLNFRKTYKPKENVMFANYDYSYL
jgi:RNA-directed DNA polymerase